MEWNAKESASFFESREYIDTCLVPIIPLSFDHDGKDCGNSSEYIFRISKQIENQFKGRILLTPPLTYFKSSTQEFNNQVLEEWCKQFEQSNFNYQVYISSDLDWKPIVEEKGYTFIWLPALPMLQMDESSKMKVILSQSEQLLNIFTSQWNKD